MRMQRINAKVCDDIPLTHGEHEAWKRWIVACASASSSSQPGRRKRKLPKSSSSRSTCGRARRRQRQWHAPGWFPGFCSSHAVFPSSVGMPEFPGILAGMYLKDSGVLFVVCGSGMSQAGFAGITPRAVFLSTVAWALMLGIMAVMDQKEFLEFLNPGSDLCKARFAGFSPRYVFPLVVGWPAGRSVWTRRTITCLAGFTGDDAPRAVLLFSVLRPKMLGIMAGVTQVNRCLEVYLKIGFFWEMTSYVSLFCSLVRQWIHV